jgi:hypothetical protein
MLMCPVLADPSFCCTEYPTAPLPVPPTLVTFSHDVESLTGVQLQ